MHARAPVSQETLHLIAQTELEGREGLSHDVLQKALEGVRFDDTGNASPKDVDSLFKRRPELGQRTFVAPEPDKKQSFPVDQIIRDVAWDWRHVLEPVHTS